MQRQILFTCFLVCIAATAAAATPQGYKWWGTRICPSGVMVTHKDTIIAGSVDCTKVCALRASDGQEIWCSHALPGYGDSKDARVYPALFDSPHKAPGVAFVIPTDGAELGLFAVSKDNGSILWSWDPPAQCSISYEMLPIFISTGVNDPAPSVCIVFSSAGPLGGFACLGARTGELIISDSNGEPNMVGPFLSSPIASGSSTFNSGAQVFATIGFDNVLGSIVFGYNVRKPGGGKFFTFNLSYDSGGGTITPVVMNNVLYATPGTNVVAVDVATQQEKWNVSKGGMIACPLLFVDTSLLLLCLESGSIAVNVESGETVWTLDSVYDTPVAMQFSTCDPTELVVMASRRSSNNMTIFALTASTGALRWQAERHVLVNQLYTGCVNSQLFGSDELFGANSIVVFDSQTGATLWTFSDSQDFWILSPVFVITDVGNAASTLVFYGGSQPNNPWLMELIVTSITPPPPTTTTTTTMSTTSIPTTSTATSTVAPATSTSEATTTSTTITSSSTSATTAATTITTAATTTTSTIQTETTTTTSFAPSSTSTSSNAPSTTTSTSPSETTAVTESTTTPNSSTNSSNNHAPSPTWLPRDNYTSHTMSPGAAKTIHAICWTGTVLGSAAFPAIAPIHATSVAVGFLSCAPFNLNSYSTENRWALFPADGLFDALGWINDNRHLREFISSFSFIILVGVLNGALHLLSYHCCCSGNPVSASHSRFPAILLIAANIFLVGTTLAATRRGVDDPSSAFGGVIVVLALSLLLLRIVWKYFKPQIFEEIRLRSLNTGVLRGALLSTIDATDQTTLCDTCACCCCCCAASPNRWFFDSSFWRPVELERRYGLLFAPYRLDVRSSAQQQQMAASGVDDSAVSSYDQLLVDSAPRLAQQQQQQSTPPAAAGVNEDDEQEQQQDQQESGRQRFLRKYRTDIYQIVNVVLFVAEGVTIGFSSKLEDCHAQVAALLVMMLTQVAMTVALRPFRHSVFNILAPAMQLSQVFLLAVFFSEGDDNKAAFGLHVVFLTLEVLFVGFLMGCIGHERQLPNQLSGAAGGAVSSQVHYQQQADQQHQQNNSSHQYRNSVTNYGAIDDSA